MDGTIALHRFSPPASSTRKTRAAGIALTILFHALLLLAFLYGDWPAAPQTPGGREINVAILDTPTQGDVSPKIVPRLIQPTAITIPAPEIEIAPEPSPITVMVQPAAPSQGEAADTNGAGGNAQSDYIERLHRHLQSFMRTVGPQGSVTIRFSINRQGKLISVSVYRSSGNRLLDAEAVALMRRAQPLPPIPEEFKISNFRASVPLFWSRKPPVK